MSKNSLKKNTNKMQIWTYFVSYNRVLFVIAGKIYHKNDLNQPKNFFVRHNQVFVITEFVITEFVITEFDCT